MVSAFLDQSPVPLLIDGAYVPADSGATLTSFNPATGEPLAEVAAAEAADIDRAVRAARRAFERGPWPAMSPAERGEALLRLAALMERDAEILETKTVWVNVSEPA